MSFTRLPALLIAGLFALTSTAVSAQSILPDGKDHHGFQDEEEDKDPASPENSDEAEEAENKNGVDLLLEPARTVSIDTSEGTWISLDMSPDSQTIIFELLGNLYSIPATGGAATPISEGMGFDSQPAYSPDGSRIAFISDRGGSENLWVANADGSEAKALTEGSDTTFTSPVWTPDGDYVVVSRSSWGLRTYELWMYHADGGQGIQLTKAKTAPNTPSQFRLNAVGPQVSPDGRYIYYATKQGGFSYNMGIPAWDIARLDLQTGETDTILTAQGSAMRPTLSPDGRFLVYATRFDAETGLRLRNLETGADDWLIFPVTRDDQESRFTRDLYPAATFTPDGSALLTTFDGKIQRVAIPDGAASEIPFTVSLEQPVGPDLDIDQTIETGPVKVRILQSPVLSPDGSAIAFSALGELYVHEFESGATRKLDRAGTEAFHPAWSPDGRNIAYITWTHEGGHIWKIRSNGRGNPNRLTVHAAYYTNPIFTPDGAQIVALRASNQSYISRGFDFGPVPTTDLIRMPADGGASTMVTHAQGLSAPHFGTDSDRIYVNSPAGLISMRLDGTDRRTHVQVNGPGLFSSEEPAAASEIRIAPNGRWALAHVSNQLHLVAVPRVGPDGVEVNIGGPSVPHQRLTDLGADYFGWSDDGSTIVWAMGSTIFRRALETVEFGDETENDDDTENGDEATDDGADQDHAADESMADSGQSEDDAESDEAESSKEEEEDTPPVLREDDENVEQIAIDLTVPRDVPEGTILLSGAKVITMNGDQVIEDGDVLVSGNRITAVGPSGSLDVPEDAEIVDVSGRVIVPGFIDTHAHWFEIRRGIIDKNHWGFLANLAYGVTGGLDVQTATNDMFAYQDMIDSGRMLGLRAFSTGPGVFSDNAFKSYDEAYGVLKRYRDFYRTRNIKAYISGNRKQRQWVIQASRELGMLPTTEGALDFKLDLTHAIDGFWGTEHSLPIVPLHKDVVELIAGTGIAYTPTLLVAYGGPWAENYFYSRSNPHDDPKLNRFTPHDVLDSKTRRRPGWFMDEEHVFSRLAAGAAQILRAGGRVGIGSHGQLQGLGYHWEMQALAAGGLTNMEVLRVATLGGAEIIGYEDEIGSIEGGKYADLVVLDADPLVAIENAGSVALVMQNGRLYDAATLAEIAPTERDAPALWFAGERPARR